MAADFPDALEIVRRLVKPERDHNNRDVYRRYWWQYGEKRPALSLALSRMDRCLAVSSISKHHAFPFISSRTVFDHNLTVLALDRRAYQAIIQSTIHVHWATTWSSGLETRLGYRPSDGFDTFPFPVMPPAAWAGLDEIGDLYDARRRDVMLKHNEALTKTYNRFHDPDETAAPIRKLRELHVAMDEAVKAAYGWTDLPLDHGFHETKQGLRYTISEAARVEVLDRLLELNHARYAEEVAQGLHPETAAEKKAAKTASAAKRASKGEAADAPRKGRAGGGHKR